MVFTTALAWQCAGIKKNTLESVVAIAQQGQVTLADIQLLHLDEEVTVADEQLVMIAPALGFFFR